MLLASWGALTLAQATMTARRAAAARDALRVRLVSIVAADSVMHPPDLTLLCLSGPRGPQRLRRSLAEGAWAEYRWRHLGGGIVLAELDLTGPGGARHHTLHWLIPDSVVRETGALRCAGSRLRPIGPEAGLLRPGE